MLAVLRRELRAYFLSPTGYIFMGFSCCFRVFLYVFQFISSQPKLSWRIGQHNIYIPDSGSILTMRLMSEESRQKTDRFF